MGRAPSNASPISADGVERLLIAGTPGIRTVRTYRGPDGDLLVDVVANEDTASETTVARTDEPVWKTEEQARADAELIALLPRLVTVLRATDAAIDAVARDHDGVHPAELPLADRYKICATCRALAHHQEAWGGDGP